jgi:flagellin
MAAASATSVNKDMETSMERLSTGKRINSAKDDAAGVAIASRLTSEIRGTNQAIRNAQDAQGLINTAEGAHKEIENILQRMRELAVQSSNDTNSATDRSNLQAEMSQLVEEIDRISSVSSWAGETLIDQTNTFKFQIGARGTSSDTANEISVTMNAMSSAALSVGAGNAAVGANGATLTEVGENVLQVGGTPVADDVYSFSVNGSAFEVELTGDDGTNFTYSYTVDGGNAVTGSASGNDAAAVAGVIATAISAQASNNPGLAASSNTDGSVTVTQGDVVGGGSDIDAVAGSTNATVAWAATTATTPSVANVTTGVSSDTFPIGAYKIAISSTTSSEVAAETFSLSLNGVSVIAETAISAVKTAGYTPDALGVANYINDQLNTATNTGGFSFEVGNSGTDVFLKVTKDSDTLITDESASAGQSSGALSISTQSDASAAIATIDAAIIAVNTQRANLGAVSNRLDNTVNNLTNISTNLEGGRGRIEDADFAAESTSLAKAQILQQASTAMLAQANASKQSVLSLLQG